MGNREQILEVQARHNADFAAFFAVAMAMGTMDSFEDIYQSYIKWAKIQDKDSNNLWDASQEYSLRGKYELTPHTTDPNSWQTANFYLNQNIRDWKLIQEEDSFAVEWEVLSPTDLEDGILLHKDTTYSMLFPYCTGCEASLANRTYWDYWSGKFLIFESVDAPQTINGRDFLNDTIEGNIFTEIPDENHLKLTGNNTFAFLETGHANLYEYYDGEDFLNSENFILNEEGSSNPISIAPTTAFLYGEVPTNAQNMPARSISYNGKINYSKGNTPSGVENGKVPTIGGGNDIFVTSIADGINIAVAAPQLIKVMSASGSLLFNGWVDTSVDVAIPGNGIYVVVGENTSLKILH